MRLANRTGNVALTIIPVDWGKRFIVLSLLSGVGPRAPLTSAVALYRLQKTERSKGILDLAGEPDEIGNPKLDMAAALSRGTRRSLGVWPAQLAGVLGSLQG